MAWKGKYLWAKLPTPADNTGATGLSNGTLSVCVCAGRRRSPGWDNRLLPRLCYLPLPAVWAADLLRTFTRIYSFPIKTSLNAEALLPWCPRETLRHSLDFTETIGDRFGGSWKNHGNVVFESRPRFVSSGPPSGSAGAPPGWDPQ